MGTHTTFCKALGTMGLQISQTNLRLMVKKKEYLPESTRLEGQEIIFNVSTRNKFVIVISFTYPYLAIAVLSEPVMMIEVKKCRRKFLTF